MLKYNSEAINLRLAWERLQLQRQRPIFDTKFLCDCQTQNWSSIIMKTQPNFTYKEFIEKLSNVSLNNQQKTDKKSPRALKTQNKNITSQRDNCNEKAFSKMNSVKQNHFIKENIEKYSPRCQKRSQSDCFQNSQQQNGSVNLKSTTNKMLKLKYQQNSNQTDKKTLSSSHNKSLKQKQKGNFYHNQSKNQISKHLQSCSTFSKICTQNDEENMSFGFLQNKSLSKSNKKLQAGSMVDAKFKFAHKGNYTDRNVQRVNTQYQRLNTQYEQSSKINYKINTPKASESPSFYRKSMNQTNFLQFQDDQTYKNLFPETVTSRSKISVNSSYSQDKKVRITQKSHQHAYNKFICQISQILFSITRIQDQNQLLEHKIKYIEYLQSLKDLKMIRNDYQPYSKQEDKVDLIRQLWEELVMGHNINHFIIIIAIILKITPLHKIEQQNSQELQNYIYLQKKYQEFRFTRLQLAKSKVYSEKQSIEYYNFPFKPAISKKSSQLTSGSKSQKKYKMNTSLNHNQSLNLVSRRQNVSISTEYEIPLNLHNQSVTSPSLRSLSPLGNKRSQILYKEGKKRSRQKKQREDKSTIDYQFQKNSQQLTFKPKITIKRKKEKPGQSTAQYVSPRFALDQEKTINRMIRGRVERQVKQMTIEKGLPYNQKVIQKMRQQKFQEVIKQQHEIRLKNVQNNNKVKLKITQNSKKTKEQKQPQNVKNYQNHNRCRTQVQNLQNILDLSFQQLIKTSNQSVVPSQHGQKKIQNSPERNPNLLQEYPDDQNIAKDPNESPEDYLTLDIYFQDDKCEKLFIKRDSGIDQINAEAQRFVLKHNLPSQMELKLKKQIINASRFHYIQKIQENAEQQECSLLM